MSKRYAYLPEMTPRQMKAAMTTLGASSSELAWLLGCDRKRIHGWLDGEQPIPPHVHMLLNLWCGDERMYELSWSWCEEHARDKRTLEA